MWTEWKLDYLKRHIKQKSHLNAVGIAQRLKMRKGIGTLLRKMLSVQQIHDHMAKYVSIPESRRSKNYAFEFLNSISEIVLNETICNVKNAPLHTLIVDESRDIQ